MRRQVCGLQLAKNMKPKDGGSFSLSDAVPASLAGEEVEWLGEDVGEDSSES
jgi:hypothetical protein